MRFFLASNPTHQDGRLIIEVESALHGQWSGINVNRIVIRYILYRLELLSRGNNRFVEREDLPFNQFTLEHILPEKWKDNWLLPVNSDLISYSDLFSEEYKENDPLWTFLPSKEGLADSSYLDAFELALERDGLRQSIGNLTIITGRLNSSMSNAPYAEKRESLFSNSTLLLNKELYRYESWDVAEIRKRERQSIAKFLTIWPEPKSFENQIN